MMAAAEAEEEVAVDEVCVVENRGWKCDCEWAPNADDDATRRANDDDDMMMVEWNGAGQRSVHMVYERE